jgi:hypothetical protein
MRVCENRFSQFGSLPTADPGWPMVRWQLDFKRAFQQPGTQRPEAIYTLMGRLAPGCKRCEQDVFLWLQRKQRNEPCGYLSIDAVALLLIPGH